MHLYDAHLPYEPAPEHLARARGDAYRGEVAALDAAVGRLLAGLAEAGVGADPGLLSLLTADHGESLGEHGEASHGALCYEAAVRVPLLFHFPGPALAPGPPRLASLVDLHPTLLGLLGLPRVPGLDGIDLFDPAAPHDRGVNLESFVGYLNYGWSPLAGWLDARGKYLHSSDPEFYPCRQDPLERLDLADSRRLESTRARARLGELLAARPALPREAHRDDEDLDRALSALGYARGEGALALPSPLEPCDRPSPASRAQELALLERASALFESGDHARCRPLLAEILRENPRHVLALDLQAQCLMHARELERAEAVLRQRLAAGPEVADAHLNLGLCRMELGRLQEALTEIEAARRLAPTHPDVLAALERVRGRLGR